MLQGCRLEEEVYRRLPPIASPGGDLGLASEVLGLELWGKADGDEGMAWVLRLYDPGIGRWLPTPAEEAEARRAAESRALALEAELARLRAELDPRR